jgi:plastocyanin
LVLTAYQHAQLMAGIPLTRASSTAAAAPTAVALVKPTPLPTTASQLSAQPTEVEIADDAFSPSTIGVTVGATLIWKRSGTHTHTVTADDSSFDSGLLRGTDQFQRTFDVAGVCAYYCDVHGGPGRVGISGVVTVK